MGLVVLSGLLNLFGARAARGARRCALAALREFRAPRRGGGAAAREREECAT